MSDEALRGDAVAPRSAAVPVAAAATHGGAATELVSAPPGVAGRVPAGAGPRREVLYFALRNKKLLVGLSIVTVFFLTAIIAPFFVSSAPNAYIGPPAASPSSQYWLGTTYFGQDVFAQFVNGLRASFLVGALGGGLAAVIGMAIGFVAGYRGGIVDEILNMVTNIFLVIPTLALLLIIGAYLSVRSVLFEAVFIGITSWPWAARAIRAQTFSLTSRDFVGMARLSGESNRRIIVREIAPNMSSYLFLTFILLFGGAILIAASYDFLGLGPTDATSLGLMMNQAVLWNALQLHVWWWFIPPGIAITAVVGGLYVTNVGLDEVFNPKLRAL
ncbi:MAG TPA: ABC transporter permease [Acidimicrobiales bacterium]|nr:ABC transporter permease [Acidimicrobiales bacterium]